MNAEKIFQQQTGALPLSDTKALLEAAKAEKQPALVASIFLVDASFSSDLLARLSVVRAKLIDLIKQHASSCDYIWHREPPSISIQQQPPHLLLRLRTGDCVEDEWFITHILHQATKQIDNLAISVEDEDGQFLLIEAAEALPKWVEPENIQNRVWIFQGHLHLVPLHYRSTPTKTSQQHSGDEEITPLSVEDALELIADSTKLTRAPDNAEAAAFERLKEYPVAASDNQHVTLAYLSRRVARLLKREPQLVTSAIEALLSRDVVSTRAFNRMKHFPVEPSTDSDQMQVDADDDKNIILTPLRLTRLLYAQLCHDRFFPPQSFGKSWQADVEKYRLRMQSAATGAVEDEDAVQAEVRQGRWRDIGAKVWCGLEMAYEASIARRSAKMRQSTGTKNASSGDYSQFLESLAKLGYFGDEMQGSARWQELEQDAKAQWTKLASQSGPTDAQEDDPHANLSERIDALLSQTATSPDEPISVPPESSAVRIASLEDNEDWMNIDIDDLDAQLEARVGGGKSEQDYEERALSQLQNLATKMEGFLQGEGDERGATFDDEMDEDDDIHDDDVDEDDGDEERQLRRQVDKLRQSLTAEETQARIAKLVPPLTEEEMRRKPPAPSEEPMQTEQPESFVDLLDKMARERAAADEGKIGTEQTEDRLAQSTRTSQVEQAIRRRLAAQRMREISDKIAKEHHDGASDSEGDEEIEQEQSPEVRRQRAAEYDLEPDQEDDEQGEEAEMPEEDLEEEEFLHFARQTLGLSIEQYNAILDKRRDRGGESALRTACEELSTDELAGPAIAYVPTSRGKEQPTQEERPRPGAPSGTAEQLAEAFVKQPAAETGATRSGGQNYLNDFDALMDEMDRRLAIQKEQVQQAQASPSAAKDEAPRNRDARTEEQMLEEELLSKLAEALPRDGEERANLIQHMLRSFQAQGGAAGPVSTLAGRFGVGNLPLNQDER